MSHISSVLDTLSQRRIVVIGDVFLDEYLTGRAERLSREAPVPVLEFQSRRHVPGGGANPAMNAAALGARASLVGVVGDDPEAAALRDLLARAGVESSGLVTDPSRPTITKTRIVAEGELRFPQHLARIDRVSRTPLDPAIEGRVLAAVTRLVEQTEAEAILVSDYRSGLVSPSLVHSLRALTHARPVLLTADTQGDLDKYEDFVMVKCNRAEAESFLGHTRLNTQDEVAQALAELGRRLGIRVVLITRGAQGLSVGLTGEGSTHIPAANASEVYDITGAGDTVIAVATLALAGGADPVTAARLANSAAGIVVRRWGNAVVTRQELESEIQV
jgi:D-glycero-beta-D-manno-heptose-7-phosphate kinase